MKGVRQVGACGSGGVCGSALMGVCRAHATGWTRVCGRAPQGVGGWGGLGCGGGGLDILVDKMGCWVAGWLLGQVL